MPDAIDLLKTRRSPRIPDLGEPGPGEVELTTLLAIAARVPDHGKLTPWRFLVIAGEARGKVADLVETHFRAAHPEATADQVARERMDFTVCPLIVGVISRAAPHPKIPEWEQMLSAGAACMNLVHAAHALGFGANWTTGFAAYDRRCLDALGLAPHEKIAGFVHIGTPKAAREERERPALDKIVTRL